MTSLLLPLRTNAAGTSRLTIRDSNEVGFSLALLPTGIYDVELRPRPHGAWERGVAAYLLDRQLGWISHTFGDLIYDEVSDLHRMGHSVRAEIDHSPDRDPRLLVTYPVRVLEWLQAQIEVLGANRLSPRTGRQPIGYYPTL